LYWVFLMSKLPISFALLLSLAACGGGKDGLVPSTGPSSLTKDNIGETVQFLLIGDQGTQQQDQLDAAQAMLKTCNELSCDFVVALGDNIYNVGPLIGTDDPQFELAFEGPYADFDIPFYMTLGNHDNGASGHIVVNGDHEVEYTYKKGTSGKWNIPSRYYNVKFGDGLVEMWSLDTDTLTAGDSVSGLRLGPDLMYSRDEQVAWMKDSIESSSANWKIAFGHYQYASEGYKGDGNKFQKEAQQEFMCDKVQFYFYGHQHQLRWEAPQESCGRTAFINSGAGARGVHEPGFPEDLGIVEEFTYEDETAAYWWMEFTATEMTAIAYATSADDPSIATEIWRTTRTLNELGWDSAEQAD
jgi:tartrate-resistant acid phosphatase type 5